MISKETCPNKLRVMMDYCADPLWDLDTHCNMDLDMFPFSNSLTKSLKAYQHLWEEANYSIEIGYEVELNEVAKLCAIKLNDWLIKNKWNVTVYWFDGTEDILVDAM